MKKHKYLKSIAIIMIILTFGIVLYSYIVNRPINNEIIELDSPEQYDEQLQIALKDSNFKQTSNLMYSISLNENIKSQLIDKYKVQVYNLETSSSLTELEREMFTVIEILENTEIKEEDSIEIKGIHMYSDDYPYINQVIQYKVNNHENVIYLTFTDGYSDATPTEYFKIKNKKECVETIDKLFIGEKECKERLYFGIDVESSYSDWSGYANVYYMIITDWSSKDLKVSETYVANQKTINSHQVIKALDVIYNGNSASQISKDYFHSSEEAQDYIIEIAQSKGKISYGEDGDSGDKNGGNGINDEIDSLKNSVGGDPTVFTRNINETSNEDGTPDIEKKIILQNKYDLLNDLVATNVTNQIG